MCAPFERCGLVLGKTAEASVHVISAKTTSQLQLTPISIPLRAARSYFASGSNL
jgi:hypothetical protein